MVSKKPTYHHYLVATEWARFRYKYAFVITILVLVAFISLIFFMIQYAKEISEHPLIYGAKKLSVECNCYNYETGRNLFVNSTDLIIKKKLYGG